MLNYKPCRKIELFKIENNIAQILHYSSTFELNGVGSLIWRLADGSRTVKEIISEIHSFFPQVDEQIIINDVQELLLNFRDKDLIFLNWDPLYKHLAVGN